MWGRCAHFAVRTSEASVCIPAFRCLHSFTLRSLHSFNERRYYRRATGHSDKITYETCHFNNIPQTRLWSDHGDEVLKVHPSLVKKELVAGWIGARYGHKIMLSTMSLRRGVPWCAEGHMKL